MTLFLHILRLLKLLFYWCTILLSKNHLISDNFFCPAANAVHGSDPCHLIPGFQFICDFLNFFHLGNGTIQAVLCLLIQIRQIDPKLAGQNQIIIQGWMILLQIVFVHPSPNPNRAVFFRKFQVGNVVICHIFPKKPSISSSGRLLFITLRGYFILGECSSIYLLEESA